jgi:hypothetical protein
VRYHVTGPLRDVVFCHCSRCRRTHGHFAAYTSCARKDLELVEERGLGWYDSDGRRRGFCRECGASVFWEREGGETIGISAGTVDPPTGLRPGRHIFTDDAGDYYELTSSERVGSETAPAAGRGQLDGHEGEYDLEPNRRGASQPRDFQPEE